MRLEELEIGGLWSFSPDHAVEMRDFASLNVVIGPNNSGKSNVFRALRFIWQHLSNVSQGDIPVTLNNLELHMDREVEPRPRFRMKCRLSATDLIQVRPLHHYDRESVLLADVIRADREIDVTIATVKLKEQLDPATVQLTAVVEFLDSNGAIVKGHATIPERKLVLHALGAGLLYLRDMRQLSDKPSSGETNFIQALHEYKAASPAAEENRRVFDQIQRLFRRLTGFHDAELQPQADLRGISVKWRGRYLPLSQLGTGFSHLLMVAFEVARSRGKLVLLEEPESGLHPGLQRVVIDFLHEVASHSESECQFLVTTHSSVMLDEGRAGRVFHIMYDGDRTSVQASTTSAHLYDVLDAIDIRPSDILQANTAIWVEGPSDRIFLQRCLQLVNCGLVEGRDYQFVCYGGSLGAYLGTSDDDDELINILRLARSIVIVADRDRKSQEAELKPSTQRLGNECAAANGLWWLTDGREIENYVSPELLTRTYRDVLGDESLKTIPFGRFDKLKDVLDKLRPEPKRGEKQWIMYDDAKARIMHKITEHMTEGDLDHLSLRKRVNELVSFLSKRATGSATISAE